ncbi:PAS domain-containing protein [Massilia sp. TWR1-2-2]|uniref:PAS domain-containing protein n=1 Tax=Massilia sp. TWR1-2-2 TaxID=2804584 RepID=UPI003CF7ADBF
MFLNDEEASSAGANAAEPAPWRILIVDDDVDVHVVTKFALSTTNFLGRRLSFFHAYSAKEGLAKLRDTPDVALILLDVMMETPDAGLRLARQVRETLHNDLVRIVLRTGQPGQALEHSIIVDYDISDFWSKTDLTTRKLFTTVIASLRAYATLAAAAQARNDALAELDRARQVQAAVDHHAMVLTLDLHGRILDANPLFCHFAGLAREQLRGRDLHAVHRQPFPEALANDIRVALARDGSWTGDINTTLPAGPRRLHCSVLAIKNSDGAAQHYIAVATPLPPA